jgi:hypothetical protein
MVSIDLCVGMANTLVARWMDKGGIVVSNIVEITIDAEAILVASD